MVLRLIAITSFSGRAGPVSLSPSSWPALLFRVFSSWIMEALVRPTTLSAPYDYQKIQRIRERIKEVFGRESLMNDEVLTKRYTLTPEGDLVMILR